MKNGIVMMVRKGENSLTRIVRSACKDAAIPLKVVRVNLRKKLDRLLWNEATKNAKKIEITGK